MHGFSSFISRAYTFKLYAIDTTSALPWGDVLHKTKIFSHGQLCGNCRWWCCVSYSVKEIMKKQILNSELKWECGANRVGLPFYVRNTNIVNSNK